MDIKGEFTSDFRTARAHADERALSEKEQCHSVSPGHVRTCKMDVQIYGVNACTSPHFTPWLFKIIPPPTDVFKSTFCES